MQTVEQGGKPGIITAWRHSRQAGFAWRSRLAANPASTGAMTRRAGVRLVITTRRLRSRQARWPSTAALSRQGAAVARLAAELQAGMDVPCLPKQTGAEKAPAW